MVYRQGNPTAAHERDVKELRAKIGELVLDIDFRKKLQALNDPEKKTS